MSDLPYTFRWDRQGRKGQPCEVLARGKMNSCLVRFVGGAVTTVTPDSGVPSNTTRERNQRKIQREKPAYA